MGRELKINLTMALQIDRKDQEKRRVCPAKGLLHGWRQVVGVSQENKKKGNGRGGWVSL